MIKKLNLSVIEHNPHTDAYVFLKINEIIDYLEELEKSSKYKVAGRMDVSIKSEEASNVTIKNNRKIVEVETEASKLYWSGEASNGECPHCDEKHMDGYAHNPKTCFMCRDNPPEHKCDHKTNYFMNAVNGCKVCSKKAQKALSRDGDPEHEEDEVEKIINPFIEKWLPDSYSHLVDTDENDGQRLRNKIRDNFVSKEKIKKWSDRLRLECDVVVCDCGERVADWDISNLVNDMIKDLGLGD